LFAGSVAENVMRHAPCPVLIVQHKPRALSRPGIVRFLRFTTPTSTGDPP
jgi:hypothetical protein